VLLEDRVKAGINRISFNGELLSTGTYFLVGTSRTERVFSKQIIKQ
jgi:hypothetical protein